MKTLFTMMVMGLILAGCEVTEETKDGNKELQPPTARNYSTAELDIGRRICSALKFKREKMATLGNNTANFNFTVFNSNCTNATLQQQRFNALIETAGTAPKYNPTTTPYVKYFSEVINDQSPVIDTLCTNLAASSAVSNVMLVDSSYYTINLLVKNSYETIELKKQSKDSSNQYPMVSNEIISFFTSVKNPGTSFIGIEKERTLSTVCAKDAKNSYSEVTQTWNGATTY